MDKQKKLFFNNIIAAFCVPIENYQRGHHIISIEEGAKAFEKCKKEFYCIIRVGLIFENEVLTYFNHAHSPSSSN